MVKIIQGFVTIAKFVNNTPGETSLIGELSTWSRTYSKEKGEYRDETVPGYQLVTFKVLNEESGQLTTLTATEAKEILEVVKDIDLYSIGHTRPYDPADFRNTLIANFYGRIADLVIGEFVDNGVIATPTFLSWSSLANGGNKVKIWLSDASFSDQYTDYSIVVIPPVTTVDMMVGNFQDAVTAINNRTIAQMGDLIQATKGDNPETYVRIYDFVLHNKNNPSQKIVTHWPILIYGKSGDNIDAIKDAITEYVRQRTNTTTQVWEFVLPELFKRTEFVIIPRWDKKAIPNLTEVAGLYASLNNLAECITFARENVSFYHSAYVEQNTLVIPYPYKTLLLLVVNGELNVATKKTLDMLYPDYLPVPSTSLDFSRMQIKTREWILFLDDLVLQAETATVITTLPKNIRRTIRDNKLFISGVFDDVNYLVAARSNAFYHQGNV